MKPVVLVTALLAIALLAGCSGRSVSGNGTIRSETRTISDFTRIEATGGYDIQWTNGPVALALTTDQNLLTNIQTVVDGDTLRIYSDVSLSPTKNIIVIVSSSALKGLELTGAIHLTANRISGTDLNITSVGAVSVDAGGNVTSLTANLTGASQLRAPGLNTTNATIELVGASSANIAVTGSLKAFVTGAGSLTYSGSPATVDQDVTGVGSIRHVP